MLATTQTDPVFALFFEANGLAAAGREPYRSVVRQLVESWTRWMAALIEGTPSESRIEAETALAVIDGLLLLRQLAGPRAGTERRTDLPLIAAADDERRGGCGVRAAGRAALHSATGWRRSTGGPRRVEAALRRRAAQRPRQDLSLRRSD